MRKCLIGLTLVLLATSGCQKLNVTGTVEVPMALTQRINFDPPAYKQDVRVTIEPETCSVSAYIVKSSDAEAVENYVAPGKGPAKDLMLAGKTFQRKDSKQDFILEATIPAKTPYSLIICGGEKTTKVKYKVVGR